MHVLAPLARRAGGVVAKSWIRGRVKIAITAWQSESGWYGDTICRQAEQAEAMGFHSYWLPENHFGDRRAIPSPLTLLAAAAVRTHRLRLGTTSYLLPIRHPIQAAEEVAVVDQLSRPGSGAGRWGWRSGRLSGIATMSATGWPNTGRAWV
jgi:alkanesulfonate monooxygenase SsuD/methylene tetrahydromethanopterin reductase-like flavin-dependent oxidoreductase (luciferase family)